MGRLTPLALAGAALAWTLGCDDGASSAEPDVGDAISADATADGAVPDAAPDAAPDALPPDAALEWARPDAPEHSGIHGFAHGCYAVEVYDGRVARTLVADGDGFDLVADGAPTPVRMQPSDLGTFLLYDARARFLVTEGDGFTGPATLESDITRMEDGYRSPAEWTLQVSGKDPTRFQLQQLATGSYLTARGLSDDEARAAVVAFTPAEGCAEFPEMAADAAGTPEARSWPDGELYGIAEIHSHMFGNEGYGGSGMFHGAPFHPLGVEHAMGDCAQFHGDGGRRDLVGFFFDNDNIGGGLDLTDALPFLTQGQVEEFVHHTDGWPTFTEWPDARRRSTHQAMYYRGLERAWRAGLRLVVQHATGNSVLCELGQGVGTQVPRHSCNDMVTVDRSIDGARALERYIDAQWGGPGAGWFRIVTSPAEARAVIAEGKLAVVLGIEISNLFDCFLTPPEGMARCTPETVEQKLDAYQARGVRVIFPVHKFDNGFSAGDGQGGIIELGNFVNTGHYTNKAPDCPLDERGFDGGDLSFSGLNRPREDYLAPPAVTFQGFTEDPLGALRPHLADLLSGSEAGDFCQIAGLTDLGEALLTSMMRRGLIPDLAHLPQRARVQALEILVEAEYPGLSTHGNTHGGVLFPFGGMTGGGIGGCGDPERPGRLAAGITARAAAREAAGAHPGVALNFDLNGFAGARGPRFGEDSRCPQPQANPVEYPFMSYDGAVTFLSPTLGERPVDFNTEGFLHIGLLPELIEDARRDGATDEVLEPLFRSAEAYVQMWERAEARAAALRE